MKYIFKSGITTKGKKYIVYYNDSDIDNSLSVAVLQDNNTFLNLRLKDTATNKSVIINGSIGRDNKLAISLIKDGVNEADTAWINQCQTFDNLNNNANNILIIDNLNNSVIVEEI